MGEATCDHASLSSNQLTMKPPSTVKPWLTAQEQVRCLKEKGVRFQLCTEDDAINYLSENNNYFRLGSYRKSFPKYEAGPNTGEYIALDFGMLVDLSIIDMLLRRQILPMTLDIEHFAKIRLLKRVEAEKEDGYEIVRDYLASNDHIDGDQTSNRVKIDIDRGVNSPYVSGLIEKYPNYDFPVWAFLEVIAFGCFIDFYKFCGTRFEDKSMRNNYYLLQKVRSIRNGCAHNNCILNNLSANTSPYRVPNAISQAIGTIPDIGKGSRKSRLSNERLLEISTTFFLHSNLASEGVHKHRALELQSFKERMDKHIGYYKNNLQVTSSFAFLRKMIDAWYRIEENCPGAPSNDGA